MNLRVAMVTPYYEPTVGGITTFVKGLTKALHTRGVTVDIVAGLADPAENVHVVGGDPRNFARESLRILNKIQPDVIHAHAHRHALAAALAASNDGLRVPVVFSFHTPWTALALRAFERLLTRADRLTFPSRIMRDAVARRLPRTQEGDLLRPATDLNPPDSSEVRQFCESWGIEEGVPVLAFVGPLQYRRKVHGVMDLIRAASLLQGSHANFRLVIAGDGRYRPRVARRARRELANKAILTGNLQRAELLLSRCDLYTHISYLEGLPLAVLEAMALGGCVVASPVGGIPEVIENGTDGVLVAGGPREIATVLNRLLDDGEMARHLGQRAAAKIKREYTWVRRGEEFLKVYGVSS